MAQPTDPHADHPDSIDHQASAEGSVASAGAPPTLVVSQEQLHVTTRSAVVGYARLEKFLVTETRTFTVQVTREEIRLVIIDPADRDATNTQTPAPAADGGADTDRWLTLSEERVIITKEVVPVERVRLQISAITQEREVSELIRKEQVDLSTEPTE